MPGAGFFLALNRDDARRLFGLREAESVFALLRELRESEEVQTEGRLLSCGQAWDGWQKTLGEDASYPLDQCVLGGRDLAHGAAAGAVLLKRPDTVAHIAETLAQPAQASAPEELRAFYRRASEQKCAVVFVVENKDKPG